MSDAEPVDIYEIPDSGASQPEGDEDDVSDAESDGLGSVAERYAQVHDDVLSETPTSSGQKSSQKPLEVITAMGDLWRALQKGRMEFLVEVWEVEQQSGRQTLKDVKIGPWLFHTMQIIGHMAPCMLDGLVAGTLSAVKAQRLPEMLEVIATHKKSLLDANHKFGQPPLCYIIELVSHDGTPPTNYQYEKIMEDLRDYPDNPQLAYEIDTVWSKSGVTIERSKKGVRRWLAPSEEDDKLRKEDVKRRNLKGKDRRAQYDDTSLLLPAQRRLQQLAEYRNAVQDRIKAVDDRDLGKPMYPVQTYVGFTGAPHSRLQAHSKHTTASNFLLNLTLAALTRRYPRDDFRTEIFLHPVISREDSILTEVMFATVRNCYHDTGLGFNIADAGLSNKLGVNLSPELEGYLWYYTTKNTPILARMQEGKEWLDRKNAERMQKEAEIERLDKDTAMKLEIVNAIEAGEKLTEDQWRFILPYKIRYDMDKLTKDLEETLAAKRTT